MRYALTLGLLAAVCAFVLPRATAQSVPPPQRQPQVAGIEHDTYVWNRPTPLRTRALRARGDLARGRDIYRERCSDCHLPTGHGLPDGTWPQLAAQHTTVLVKQIADIIEGTRDNPVMYPYARELSDPQKLADVAFYVSLLRLPRSNGKGPGTALDRGRELYERDCVRCHGALGEGNAESFFPVLSGQHYAYLLRQSREIASGVRRNAHPEMAAVVGRYADEDLKAVVDYLSRLEWPARRSPK